MAALTFAMVVAIATSPACGNAPPDNPLMDRLVATAQHESKFDPLAIGVNAEPSRGLGAAHLTFRTQPEAAAAAQSLLKQGRRIDLGLMQISSANLTRHGLTLWTAFDACKNMGAGRQHLTDDFQAAAWTLAHERYNCGAFTCSQAYAAAINAIVAANAGAGNNVSGVPGPASPVTPPCAPEWDAWARASCTHTQIKPTDSALSVLAPVTKDTNP